MPYLIVDPRQTPGRTRSLAGSIDIPSTLLDVCGIDGYHGMQGASLVPVLADPNASVRDAVLIEDDMDMTAMPPFPTSIRTLITETHRYSRCDTGEDEVYELHVDDDERTNLAATDLTLRNELVGRLTDAMIAHTDKANGAPVA